jgi:hypothetical protein
MTKFSWGGPDRLPLVVEGRFEGLPGYKAWSDLIEVIANPEARDRELFSAFDYFLRAIDLIDRNLVKDCVFISHRQTDWSLAEEVARTVTKTSRDYWLDIHDPTLRWASKKVGNLRSVAYASCRQRSSRSRCSTPRTSSRCIPPIVRGPHGSLTNLAGPRPARFCHRRQPAGSTRQRFCVRLLGVCPPCSLDFSHQDVENWLVKRGRYA